VESQQGVALVSLTLTEQMAPPFRKRLFKPLQKTAMCAEFGNVSKHW
jgi:hypothetical protein